MEPDDGVPAGAVPSDVLNLTPELLKGLTHPIRLRLLGLLGDEGPATATSLAARIGRSSGVTSYHLRVLADNGLIVEDADRGNGRDRFWRGRFKGFTVRMSENASTEETDTFLHYAQLEAGEHHRRILAGIDMLSPDQLPTAPWTLSNRPLRLTVEEARELATQIEGLADRYHREQGDPDPRPGTFRAYFQFQLLPDEEPLSDEEPETDQ